MSRHGLPDGLSDEEAALWAKLARTVTPLKSHRPRAPIAARAVAKSPEIFSAETFAPKPSRKVKGRVPAPLIRKKPAPIPTSAGRRPDHSQGLDSHWERRFNRGGADPDFTLDLHGHTLDQAHQRLDTGISQAKSMGARVVLVITGKSRPVDAADRGDRRGAIRAKVLDWLAAGPHGGDISAVRNAHRKHGGSGAIYLVLRRR